MPDLRPTTRLEEKHLEEIACKLCGSARGVLWRERLDERVGYRFRNMWCADCGLVYVSPRLRQEWREAFNSWEAVSDRGPQYEAQVRYHIFTAKRRLRRLERYLGAPGKILDVGCATGYFLCVARELGWQVQGVEIDPKPAAQARERFGLLVTVGTLAEARCHDREFDCVHLNDVIEHLPDPLATLLEARRILKPGGVLFVGTHNLSGLRARLSGVRWADLGGLDHLFCFTPRTLRAMLRKAGFEVLRMASGEGLAESLVSRALKGRNIGDAYRAVEASKIWHVLYEGACAIRTATRLGSEIQFYATHR